MSRVSLHQIFRNEQLLIAESPHEVADEENMENIVKEMKYAAEDLGDPVREAFRNYADDKNSTNPQNSQQYVKVYPDSEDSK